jgi:hypothetical protein
MVRKLLQPVDENELTCHYTRLTCHLMETQTLTLTKTLTLSLTLALTLTLTITLPSGGATAAYIY